MGIGMQIAYVGFPGAARIEAEAGVQLLRLMRFAQQVSACRLTVEALEGANGTYYDVWLDIVTPEQERVALPHCSDTEPEAAVRAAFDHAERELGQRGGSDG
ncbi:hypothetical protein [Trinickia dinghuensis]|uniref:Metal ABC transporter ATPase n=1 Tax=Trinickia dinghuensis TaxID=2291023 RepID=A0A3D8JX14_9BURK|nr:hypothetical protein [Trinickia dinghuensis]RDU97589.1 hypothetical protein DWV00_17070 [Trinickia dinghuensis]